MPEDTTAQDSTTSPAIPLLPAGPDAAPGDETESFSDPHLERTFRAPAAEGASPESSERMRALLARAVGDRSEEQRTVVETLAELRELVPQIHLQMQDTASTLEAQLSALGEHVAEQEAATGRALGERLQGITSELDTQAQLSAALSDALAAIAADLDAIPALHDAVRHLAEQPVGAELRELQNAVAAQGLQTAQSVHLVRATLEDLVAQGAALPADVLRDHLERTAVREAAVQDALQSVLVSLNESESQQRDVLSELRGQGQGHQALLASVEAVREHLQRPDTTGETLATLDARSAQHNELLAGVQTGLNAQQREAESAREAASGLRTSLQSHIDEVLTAVTLQSQQHQALLASVEAVREHLQRPDTTGETLAALAARSTQHNELLAGVQTGLNAQHQALLAAVEARSTQHNELLAGVQTGLSAQHQGLLASVEAVREHLQRPDTTGETLAALAARSTQHNELLAGVQTGLNAQHQALATLAEITAQAAATQDLAVLTSAVQAQAQRQEGVVETLEVLREHLQRPDTTSETLSGVTSQLREQEDVLRALRAQVQEIGDTAPALFELRTRLEEQQVLLARISESALQPDTSHETLSALREQIQVQGNRLDLLAEVAGRPDPALPVLGEIGTHIQQQNDVLLAIGEQIAGSGSAAVTTEVLGEQLREQQGSISALRAQIQTQDETLHALRSHLSGQEVALAAAAEREQRTQEVLHSVVSHLASATQGQELLRVDLDRSRSESAPQTSITPAEVEGLVAASEKRVTDHLDQTLYSLVELLVQRRRVRSADTTS